MQQERDTTLDSGRIDQWLAEDLGPGDVTTRATLGADRTVQASWIAKADGIVAGLAEARAECARMVEKLKERVAPKTVNA